MVSVPPPRFLYSPDLDTDVDTTEIRIPDIGSLEKTLPQISNNS